jgi:hypothetical protein
MKKVYRTVIIPTFLGFAFLGTIWKMIKYDEISFGPYVGYLIVLGGFFVWDFWLTFFIPMWTYNDQGFEILEDFNKKVKQKYKWSQVERVFREREYRSLFSHTTVRTTDGSELHIGFTRTQNSHAVLTDLIRYVQKANPKVVIDPWVIKAVERHL